VTTFPTEEELKATCGGTVWIKHVENLNYERQETLSRLIQRSEGVRFIVSATRAFEEGLANGRTHPDFYRLVSEKIVYMPRLSSRTGEEVVKLAHFVATKMCIEQGRVFQGFDPSVEEFFQKYSWPGNESELVSIVERSLVLTKGNKKVTMAEIVLLPDSVGPSRPIEIHPPLSIANSPSALAEGYTELKKHFTDLFEKEFLIASLRRHTGNVSQAAREAKLDRSNYLRLLRRHNIKSEAFRRPSDVDQVASVTEIKKAS
jgi:DNA-binding NtrC family response regulator